MPTYLACFIVCDFGNTSSEFSDDNLPFRVFSSKHQVDHMQYALETGVSIVNYYINYFGIDYPLPKLGKEMLLRPFTCYHIYNKTFFQLHQIQSFVVK